MPRRDGLRPHKREEEDARNSTVLTLILGRRLLDQLIKRSLDEGGLGRREDAPLAPPFFRSIHQRHGIRAGNVLFAEGLPPAIIDFSPYWRPAAFASAIVVADALVWEGADAGLLDAVAHIDRFDQFLLRGLIYRMVTDRLFREHDPIRPDDADPCLPAVELACRLVTSP